MTKIKYVAVNINNNEPLYESDSYMFLSAFVRKITAKSGNADQIKIYKKVIVETVEEVN